AAEYAVLKQGAARGEFVASLGSTQAFSTELFLKDLVAVTEEALPSVTAQARVEVAASGQIEAEVPLQLEQAGRLSDALLKARVQPEAGNVAVDAHLSSRQLIVDDVKGLVLPLAALPKTPADPSAPPEPGPVWQGITGQLVLDLKKVVYSEEIQVSEV